MKITFRLGFAALGTLTIVAPNLAHAWDLQYSFSRQSYNLGKAFSVADSGTGATKTAHDDGFKGSLNVHTISLGDNSGELSAGASGAARMASANLGAQQDAQEKARKSGTPGTYTAERSFTIPEAVAGGRSSLNFSYGTGSTDTYTSTQSGTAPGPETALPSDYSTTLIGGSFVRNITTGNFESLLNISYDLDLGMYGYRYTVSGTSATPVNVLTGESRWLYGVPLDFTLGHSIVLENLVGRAHFGWDLGRGILAWAGGVIGQSFTYGAEVSFAPFESLAILASYDVRTYGKGSKLQFDDGSKLKDLTFGLRYIF